MDLTVVFEGADSSPADLAAEELRSLGLTFESRGGGDPREGTGEFVLSLPAGVRLPKGLLEKMWERRAETEAVLASRYLPSGRARFSFPASVLARRGSRLVRRVLRLPCSDPTSPVRLYKRAALREAAPTSRNPLELLVALQNAGFKIREVPYEETATNGRGGLGDVVRALLALPRLRRLRNSADAADSEDARFESLLPWRRRYQETRQRTIVGFLEVDVPVLDVGCGSNRLIQTLSKGIGLDRDRRKLRFLRGRARATVSGELARLPFRDGSFRQAVFSDVLGSLSPDEPYLPELRRILTPHGTLVLSATDDDRHDEASLRDELSSHGFAVDEVRRVRREIVVRAVRKELQPPSHQDGAVGTSAR